MIMKDTHPWSNFLHARKLAIEWLIKNGNSFEQIANSLSMDVIQVQLIHMTDVEI